MNVLVVGAGAIGGYVGARLALAGHAVTFVGRSPLAEAFAARGLTLIEPEGQFAVSDCRVVTSVAEAFASIPAFDLALFTVKTCDTASAIDELRPYAQRIDRFLSLQNGLSSEDLLGDAFGREKIVAGTILNPVSVREPGVVMLEKRKGGLGAAALDRRRSGDDARRLADTLQQAGFVIRVYAEARSMKWSKLILNLIGNASSAILDWNTMEVFADKRTFVVEVAALREAIRVARAERARFVRLPGYPVPLLVASIRWMPLPFLQSLLAPLVAGGRGAKMPSLHIDLRGGKGRSEIDELNGAVVRLGARHNIPTPANAVLVDTFRDLQPDRAKLLAWKYRADRLWDVYTARAEATR